jgi:hypothetical protein
MLLKLGIVLTYSIPTMNLPTVGTGYGLIKMT